MMIIQLKTNGFHQGLVMTKNMKVKQGFVKTKLADNYVVVPTGRAAHSEKSHDAILKLNETASVIWDNVCDGLSQDEIARIMMQEYAVSYEKALEDVKKVFDTMKEMECFEI